MLNLQVLLVECGGEAHRTANVRTPKKCPGLSGGSLVLFLKMKHHFSRVVFFNVLLVLGCLTIFFDGV